MNFVKLLYFQYFIIQYIENGVKIKIDSQRCYLRKIDSIRAIFPYMDVVHI